MVLKRVAESTSWIFMVLRDESRSNSVGLSRRRGRVGEGNETLEKCGYIASN